MSLSYNTTSRDTRLDALTSALGTAAFLEIFTGSPAGKTAGTFNADTGTKLASLACSNPVAPGSSAGVLTFSRDHERHRAGQRHARLFPLQDHGQRRTVDRHHRGRRGGRQRLAEFQLDDRERRHRVDHVRDHHRGQPMRWWEDSHPDDPEESVHIAESPAKIQLRGDRDRRHRPRSDRLSAPGLRSGPVGRRRTVRLQRRFRDRRRRGRGQNADRASREGPLDHGPRSRRRPVLRSSNPADLNALIPSQRRRPRGSRARRRLRRRGRRYRVRRTVRPRRPRRIRRHGLDHAGRDFRYRHPDTAAIAGWCIVGSLGGAGRNDALAGLGGFATSGAAAPTAGNDTLAALGLLTSSASMAATAGSDTASIAGMLTSHAVGNLMATGSDVLSALGFIDPPGVLTATGRNDTFTALGGMTTTAALAATERHDTLAAFSQRRPRVPHLQQYRHRRPDRLFDRDRDDRTADLDFGCAGVPRYLAVRRPGVRLGR